MLNNSRRVYGRAHRVVEGGVLVVNAGNGEGVMESANNIVHALLSVVRQVAVGQVVAGKTVESRESGASQNRQRQTWKSTHVIVAGGQTRRGANRAVVCELNVSELQVPVVLSFIGAHS